MVAAAVVTAATPTGTKTATLDTAAAPTIVTTTLPAIMHRTGRTIHPLAREGISVVELWTVLVHLQSPSSNALRADSSPRLRLLHLPLQVRRAAAYLLQQRRVPLTVSLRY